MNGKSDSFCRKSSSGTNDETRHGLVEDSDDVIKPLDGGWGWCVAGGLMLHMGHNSGIVRSFTFLYLAMLDRYKQSDTLTSVTLALMLSVYFIFSFVTGMLSNRYPARTLALVGSCFGVCGMLITAFAPSIYVVFLGLGLLQGISMALGMAPGMVILNQYFKKKKATAFGIVNTSKGISSFTIPPLMAFLLNYYGWTGALLINTGIGLHTFIGSLLFRPLENNYPSALRRKRRVLHDENVEVDIKHATSEPELDTLVITRSQTSIAAAKDNIQNAQTDSSSVNSVKKKCFHFGLLKHYKFMCFAVGLALFNFGITSMAFLAPLGKELGFSSGNITLLVTLYGVADLAGALLLGYLFDVKKLKRHRYHLFYLLFFLNALMSLCVGLLRDFVPFMIAVVCKGLVVNVFWMRVPILSDIIGDSRVASGIGIMSPLFGIGNLAGPTVGGLLKDQLHSYKYVMHFAAAVTVLSTIVLVMGIFERKKKATTAIDREIELA